VLCFWAWLQRSAPSWSQSAQEAEAPDTKFEQVVSPIFLPVTDSLPRGEDLSSRTIAVSVIGCENLPECIQQVPTECHPYCIVQLGNQTKTTHVKHNVSDPYFGEEFCFQCATGSEEMTVTIKHQDCNGDQILGWVSIPPSCFHDYAKQSKMEHSLDGLSILRPSSPKSLDVNHWGSLEASLPSVNVNRCSEMNDKELRQGYPGMQRFQVQGIADSGKMQKIEGVKGAYLMMQFRILDTPAMSSSICLSSIPVFDMGEGALLRPSDALESCPSPEVPISMALSFAEDIVPFALDSALLSEWTFSIHRDLSMATSEHHSRFDLVSSEIKDVVTINLVVRPIWMLPDVQSKRTAKELASEIKRQVHSMHSKLRCAIPSLFRIIEDGHDKQSDSGNESVSSSTSDDMGSSVESLSSSLDEEDDKQAIQNRILADDQERQMDYADLSQSSDEEIKLEVAPAPKGVRAVAPPPHETTYATLAKNDTETNATVLLLPGQAKSAIANLKVSIIERMPQLHGAELYSNARQSLG